VAMRPRAFVALEHRNYRLLWMGLFVSMAGSMMRNAALLWHVSLLVPEKDRAMALGGMGLVRVLPIVLCSLWAGLAADALDRRKLLFLTNAVMLCNSSLLAALTFSGSHSLPAVYALAALSAAASTVDNPARNSFFPELVPREHLANAISLNSIVFQAASVLGPMIGGLVIAGPGLGWVYVIDAASFVVLLAMLGQMRDLPERSPAHRSEVSLKAALEGIRFVFGRPLIRSTMLLDAFATFFASATALLPIYAQDVLHVGARGYGLLSSAAAVGAVVTSFVMVGLVERIERRGRAVILAASAYGVATIVFGVSSMLWLSLLALFFSGAADMVSTVLRNVIRQLETPDGLRGRMSSVNMVFFMGGPQLGELEAGLVAHAFGPVVSVVSGGLGCLLSVLTVAWRTPALVEYRRDSAPPK
jgi:MFS family permease